MSSTSSTGKKLFFLMGYECVAEASWQIKVKVKTLFPCLPRKLGGGVGRTYSSFSPGVGAGVFEKGHIRK